MDALVGAIHESPDIVHFRKVLKLFSVLTHSPQGLSCRALVNPGTKEGEVLANASRRLAAHPPPLETSPCTVRNTKSHLLPRACGEYQIYSF